MTLDEYLTQKIESSSSLARKLGVPNVSISNWRYGKRQIPLSRMTDIEIATNGKVSRKDLCSEWERHWPELASKQKKSA